ncbi:MAG: hypothetical protein ACI9WU_003246 [Myxococcota bacterium]|jgi:hypothetical protein
MAPSASEVESALRAWVDEWVVGLNLCPFARPVVEAHTLRYVVSEATDQDALVAQLEQELKRLTSDDPAVATTLVITPRLWGGKPGRSREEGFLDMNDFMAIIDALLVSMDLDGVIQVPFFHPQFCFGGVAPADPANRTNRAPYPAFHLLREADVTDAATRHPDLSRIPEDNVARLRELFADEPEGPTRL